MKLIDTNVGQIVNGDVTANVIHFNVGGRHAPASALTDEELLVLEQKIRKAVTRLDARCLLPVGVFALELIAVTEVLRWVGLPPDVPTAQRLNAFLLLGVPVFGVTFMLIGDLWREYRDVRRSLRRALADVVAQLYMRDLVPPLKALLFRGFRWRGRAK